MAKRKPDLGTEELDQFNDALREDSLGPLWTDLPHMITREPQHDVEPYLWKWDTIRSHVLKSGELLKPGKDSERRVVYLQNPGLLERGLIGYGTNTLYAGIQLLKPGEKAPPHIHSQGAIRFIIEGSGAYTSVSGEKITMEPGDLVLTPPHTWHEHGHEGSEPVLWMDGLDVGLVKSFAGSFFQPYDGESYPLTRPTNYSNYQFSAPGMLPVNSAEPGYPSPLLCYRWTDTKQALGRMSEGTPEVSRANPHDGYALKYVNPATAGPADARIGTMIQKLPVGAHLRAHRHVHSAIYHVVGGDGYTVIDGQKFEWGRGDFFVVPPWSWHEHANTGDTDVYLFSINDAHVLEVLGLERYEDHPSTTGYQEITSVFRPK